MRKVLKVAVREFEATVATKGFIFGLLVTPLIIMLMVVVMPRLMNQAPPKVIGEVAVIDPTGQVAPSLKTFLAPEAIAGRREARRQRLQRQAAGPGTTMAEQTPQGRAAMQRSLDAALGAVPQLTVVPLAGSAAEALLVDPRGWLVGARYDARTGLSLSRYNDGESQIGH